VTVSLLPEATDRSFGSSEMPPLSFGAGRVSRADR
jgi:hypothetical protein